MSNQITKMNVPRNFFGQGPPGANQELIYGQAPTDRRPPREGDSYTDTLTNNLWIYQNNTWNNLLSPITLNTVAQIYAKYINSTVRIACISNTDLMSIMNQTGTTAIDYSYTAVGVTATIFNPGTGHFYLNSNDADAVTDIIINATSNGNTAINNILGEIQNSLDDQWVITLRCSANPGLYSYFNITDVTEIDAQSYDLKVQLGDSTTIFGPPTGCTATEITFRNTSTQTPDMLTIEYNKFFTGSGFFIISATSGYIATATHVILSPIIPIDPMARIPPQDNIYVQVFPENKILKATVIGYDNKMDIALLKITPPGPRQFLSYTNSRDVKIGSPAIALNNSYVMKSSTTRPIIQGLSFGTITDNKFTDDNMHVESVVTDNDYTYPADGGPLIDLYGNYLGITSWVLKQFDDTFQIRGSVASYLVRQVINCFILNYTGTPVLYQKYAADIKFRYVNAGDLVNIRGVNLNLGNPQFVQGVIVLNNMQVDRYGNTNIEMPTIDVQEGDIILSIGDPDGDFLPIGTANNQFPLDTEIMFNPVINLEILSVAEGYMESNFIFEVELQPYPVLYDYLFTQLT